MYSITLKSLPFVTAQEVFDQVAYHLLKQNKKSLERSESPYTCAYRTNSGLKCAAGCLIGDDEYNKNFEKQSWHNLVENFGIPKNHYDLIRTLQNFHDLYEVEKWHSGLKQIAKKFKLEFNF